MDWLDWTRYGVHRWTLAIVGWLILWPVPGLSQEETRGLEIYRKLCASCHGANGEGVPDEYADALIGDRSVKELTTYIHDRMPEGDPEQCVGEDAAHVARYIYDAFYSEIAQARNRPATIELSRLTIRQYENAVADLLCSFGPQKNASGVSGLHGEYYNSKRPRRDNREIDRIDAVVDFNFGPDSPLAEKIKPEEFSITWEGSVFAPDTGDYEFITESQNGVRLWVNDQDKELIDAWVKSGDETIFKGTIRLLGGRWYPLRFEFFKFKEQSASVRLKWKPPHGAEDLIPQRLLSTAQPDSTFVITTPFPPDDRSTGYEVGTAISHAWEEATTYAALEVADHIQQSLNRYAGIDEQAADRTEKIRRFCVSFVERAFRRPLSEDDRAFFVDSQFPDGMPVERAVKRIVLLAMKSPRFLYREYGFGPLDDDDVAAWLAFSCWDSIPDEQLIQAAANGELQTREQVESQVDRMLIDPRARTKMREFLHQWLNVSHLHEIVKSREAYPQFDASIAADLRTSLDLFLNSVVWSEASDFRQLLLSGDVFLNGRLGMFYGQDVLGDAPFQKVELGHEGRAGVLSHPYLMAGFAYDTQSSPIHRGVFVSRGLLGRRLKPPPNAVTPVAPELEPHLSTRERITKQTSAAACQSCHGMINPLGFSLEQFDAVGRFRAMEKDRPVDDRGGYLDRQGEQQEFQGATGLAQYLANSGEAHEAFIEQQFQYFVKQPVRAFGDDLLPQLTHAFSNDELHIRRALARAITESTFRLKQIIAERSEQNLSSGEHQQ